MNQARILFTPSGRQGTVEVGTTILDAARSLGVDLDSICGGRGICGRCQVQLGSSKTVPLDPTRISSPGPTELDYKGRRVLEPGHRLGCAARILSDVVIDVPPTSQVHRQVVRKRAEVPNVAIDPVIRLYYVEVPEAALGAQGSDSTRLLASLAEQWDLPDLTLDPRVLPELQQSLLVGKSHVTAAVRDRIVCAVWPGFRDLSLGVAFDVGSTTIAGHLCDLHTGEILASHGEMNPQIRYGEDVMSRVSYAMMHEGGAGELTGAVRSALDRAVGALVDEADVERSDILEITLVGNPIMHHIFLGLDPTPLGAAPFSLVIDEAVEIETSELGIHAHPRARAYVLPCIAGHVGADAAGAMLSEAPHRDEAITLLVDVGTNAEIVLGNSQRLLAASSPTGPAFEGAQITSGQRAAPGAIERVRIDPKTLEPRIKLVGGEYWSDEDGFADDVEATPITGICGSGIIEAIGELFLAGVIGSDGQIRQSTSARVIASKRTFSFVLWDSPRILVTQEDVRAIQLAKAALQAGARLLMDHFGTETIDQIRLAGAFGSHIDTMYAMVIGMIPDCDLSRVSAAGNAAGAGAIIALLSGEKRREIGQLVGEVEKIETATEAKFQEHFVASLALPHQSAPYPHLRREVNMPEPTRPDSGRRRRRERSPNHG